MTTENLSLEAAEALCRAALIAANTSAPNAASVARALVKAEVDGQRGHGLSRVPTYCAQSAVGKVDGHATPTIEQTAGAALRTDAAFGFAYPAYDLTLPRLADLAGEMGVAVVAIRRCHHFGVAGHHCEALAERGRIAFVYGNSPKALAPHGATRALLGTNPIAFAAPMPDSPPLVVDMAVTTVARGKILAAKEAGQVIPEGWALDSDGAPTTDPVAALDGGTMAPIGGPKGAALALMVEVMSACLVGASLGTEGSSLLNAEGGPPDIGQSIIALDPSAFSDSYMARMGDLAALYAETEGARLPGTRRLASRAEAARNGLQVPTSLLTTIRAIAAGTT